MGNSVASPHSDNTRNVILTDGTVHEFPKPVTAAELMLEYPQQVVVEFQTAVSGKRPAPLPADQKLEAKKLYLMLPMKRGKPAMLSSEEVRRLFHTANSFLRSRSLFPASKFLNLFAKVCPAGAGDGEGLVVKKKEKVEPELMTEIMEVMPEYLSRQFSGKGNWKPNLDTIKEKKVEKVSHWLF